MIDLLRWAASLNPLLILLMMFGVIVLFVALGTFVSDVIAEVRERFFPARNLEGGEHDGW